MRTSFIFAAFLAVFALAPVMAQAQVATSAREGTVVAIQVARATPSQTRFHKQSNARAEIGAALGGVLGWVAARHSSVGRYVGAGALGTVGYAVGHELDQSHAERRSVGAQIIVKMVSGNAVAIFAPIRAAGQFHPGEKVWVVGNDQLVAAQ